MTVFEQGRTDVVTAVLIPVDGLTRVPVRSGVDAQLWDPVRDVARPNRLVRNLSGHLVLVNEPRDRELVFRVDPAAAGYRGPLFVTVPPAAKVVPRVVILERRPDAAFDPAMTLVRGWVVRSAGPVAPPEPVSVPGLTVTATPRSAAGSQFPATTDERGVFALVVGLRAPVTDDPPVAIHTVLRFEKAGLPVRELTVDLDRGRTHAFADAVDLDGDEQPDFTTSSERSTRS